MIAKHVPMRSVGKSDFAGLVRYITDVQSKDHRLGHVQVTNCDAYSVRDTITEVLATQYANTRAESDKTRPLIVSFPAGEQPSADTLKAIEERICAGLGYGEHQRVSAVHNDTDNLHVHIAIIKNPGSPPCGRTARGPGLDRPRGGAAALADGRSRRQYVHGAVLPGRDGPGHAGRLPPGPGRGAAVTHRVGATRRSRASPDRAMTAALPFQAVHGSRTCCDLVRVLDIGRVGRSFGVGQERGYGFGGL